MNSWEKTLQHQDAIFQAKARACHVARANSIVNDSHVPILSCRRWFLHMKRSNAQEFAGAATAHVLQLPPAQQLLRASTNYPLQPKFPPLEKKSHHARKRVKESDLDSERERESVCRIYSTQGMKTEPTASSSKRPQNQAHQPNANAVVASQSQPVMGATKPLQCRVSGTLLEVPRVYGSG